MSTAAVLRMFRMVSRSWMQKLNTVLTDSSYSHPPLPRLDLLGVTAKPQCALENKETGDKYCVLICHEAAGNSNLRAGDAQCGDATCQVVQPGLGVCTYE